MHKRHLLALLGLSALAALSACTETGPAFAGVNLTGADYAKDFRLPDHNGQPRSLADFKGKVVTVFFGYTQCPDVCPTSMLELAEVKRLLGPQGDKFQGIFITVDPARDTAELLKAYMGSFDPTFLALRGTPEQTAQVEQDFKIYAKKVDGKTPTSYTMDHSAGSYTYDTQGRLRLYHAYATRADKLAGDIRLLLGTP